jgi:PAS domain-containing protein
MLFDLLIPWVITAAAITWLVIMWQNRPPAPNAPPPPPVIIEHPYAPAEIIVSVIDIGILFVNSDGIVLMHNPAASELLELAT